MGSPLAAFVLPKEIKPDPKINNGAYPLKSPIMIAKTFQALTPWFANIVPVLESSFQKGMNDSVPQAYTLIRLQMMEAQVNAIKTQFEMYISNYLGTGRGPVTLSAEDGDNTDGIVVDDALQKVPNHAMFEILNLIGGGFDTEELPPDSSVTAAA